MKPGTKIITHDELSPTTGMFVHPDHITNRKTGCEAVILGYVPGHGGDVWLATNADGTVAAYGTDEFDALHP